jgi:hypothetical protein
MRTGLPLAVLLACAGCAELDKSLSGRKCVDHALRNLVLSARPFQKRTLHFSLIIYA